MALVYACRNGNLQLAKELMKRSEIVNADIVLAFKYACWCEHFHVAKWLLKTRINLDTCVFDKCFSNACHKGQLKLVKWIWKHVSKIDIRADNDYLFRTTCYHGHLSVVKWLWKHAPDIDLCVYSNYAYVWACIMGHVNVKK